MQPKEPPEGTRVSISMNDIIQIRAMLGNIPSPTEKLQEINDLLDTIILKFARDLKI